jgi:Carboxypeptidase regulatory-like domain/TonB-dependent Receptor Plug Domain
MDTSRGMVSPAEGGAPVAGAQVAAVNAATGFRRAVTSDAGGRFTIALLPPGTYRLEARGLGYAQRVVQNVAVRLGEATTVEVRLAAEAVQIEGITATAAGGGVTVDATQGGVVQTVSTEQVENLPVQGRDFTDFLNLSPLVSPQPAVGTGGQFSIGGARTSGTNVQIDGADANNQFFGENRGSSRTPFAFSLESIKEFQLITNGFDVEYGNYQGGVVNAVTRGGANQFRASAFVYGRDQKLTGTDFTGQEPTDYSVFQYGFNVSGPVVKDRLHYFVSLDGQRKDQPVYALVPSVSGIPQDTVDSFLRILRDVYGFPSPEQLVGTVKQAEDNLVLFGRVDWTLSAAHRLTVRGNWSDFEQTNDRLSTTANETLSRGGPFQNRSLSTVAELSSVLGGGRVFNTLRVQYSDEDRPRPANEPGGYLPEIRIDDVIGTTDIFAGGDGVIFRNRLEEDKVQVVDNLTVALGRHTLKVGTNNILSNTTNEFFLLGNGAYRFRNMADFAANRPNQYTRNVRACPVALVNNAAGQAVVCPQLDVPVAEFSSLEWSVYAQDEWQATDRLLVTPGIRFGGTRLKDAPEPVAALEAAFTEPGGTRPLKSDEVPSFTGVSPRLAFTYDAAGDGGRLVRGGVGLLIGRAPAVLAGNVFQTERPLLRVDCRRPTGAGPNPVPVFDPAELLAGERGANNPAVCASGAGPSGNPEHAVFSRGFELPKTLKANLGYTHLLGETTRLGVDLIFSRTRDNYFVQDLNLQDAQFSLANEAGRPVFVQNARFNPLFGAGNERLRNPAFNRVFYNVSDAEARSLNLSLEAEHRPSAAVQLGARYALTRASDNSSFGCCTSQEGFDEPTAGDPNFVGDAGDDRRGTWGPSDFERRHTFVLNFLYRAPHGIRASGIWRSTSGTPWTPIVEGDVNGDGIAGNDRAYVGDALVFATPADEARFDALVRDFGCLQQSLGRIVGRNACRNPWFHSVDLRLAKDIRTFGRQRAELLLDFFNVLNFLNDDWGRFMGVFGDNAELLQVQGFNRTANTITYRVNEDFGRTRPVGFDPFQYQVQLGVRYSF